MLSDNRCRVAVLASGTGSNFEAIAEACRDDGFPARVVCVISDKPDAPVLERARARGVSAHLIQPPSAKAALPPETENAIVNLLRQHDVELVALAGFMRILKGPLLEAFENRIMNIHPSLLPSFKGLDGVGQALDYGAKVVGCTVHFVDRSVDGGAIILQAPVLVEAGDDKERVLEKVHREEHRIYVEAVRLFAEGRLRSEGRRVRIVESSNIK